MGGRGRAQSTSGTTNSKAQLISAYNELGKELSDTRMRVVGNYNIGRVIGEGSYGKVRLGTHRLTGTRVALKQIPKSVSAQLTREIHHHRQLHHPHVVQLYEVIATETSIWLVTELCAGGELFDYLVEKGRVDEYESRLLFAQLCLAVAYCHDQGVVHRDLKLENVLLDDHCRVKLSDFGFTREFERGVLLETFCGTTGYASPEMLMGQKYLGQEVDIWSLGIILYALLTGTLPFDDDDEQKMKTKIIAGEFEDPEWLSSESRDLINSILVQDPLKRLSMQQILSHPWFSKVLHPSTPPMPSLELSRSPSAVIEPSGILTSEEGPANTNEEIQNIITETPKTLEGHVDSGPKRQLSERKGSSASIAPPMPTRTPVRTKRRSVSSTMSPPSSPKARPVSIIGPNEAMDLLKTLTQQTTIVFSTPQERAMLTSLAAMGFDTGQIVHSVLSNACDSAGAVWWILRKKLSNNLDPAEEMAGSALAVADPFMDSSSTGHLQVQDTDVTEGKDTTSVEGPRPPVLVGEVDPSKRKRRATIDNPEESDTKSKAHNKPLMPSPPDFTIVPATPIVDEDQSKGKEPPPPDTSSLLPTHSPSTSPLAEVIALPSSSPPSSKASSSKTRSGSISMLQRATTVLGGAASLVRKKSDENGLVNHTSPTGSTREKEKSVDEPRSSSGSGGRLTKSPPPGKISKEARERESIGEASGTPKNQTPSTYPGHSKSQSAVVHSATPRRSITDGGRPTSPMIPNRDLKPRTRASILSTFRMWFDDGRRKRKTAASFSTPANSPAGAFMSSSPSAPGMSNYFPSGSSNGGLPERPYTPRRRMSASKGTGPRRSGRGHKDKRPSISSRRSSSVNSRRSSVGSLASMANVAGTLGSVGEYTVFTGPSMTRKLSDGSKRGYGTGAKTPIEDEPSRPGSARSFSQSNSLTTGPALKQKRHSKSSSTSSGGSLGRSRGDNSGRPSSRSANASPTGTSRAHRRAGSGGSQSRAHRHHVKKSSSIAKVVEAHTANQGKHARRGSLSSVHSDGSSLPDEETEFGSLRLGSPIVHRTNFIAQKKQGGYGMPSGSLGHSMKHSSWKKAWGAEPPGWATRATQQSVIVEILDPKTLKGNIRDVFAGGGKSGAAPNTSLVDDGNDDDWSDVDDDVLYAGGLGQYSTTSSTSQNGLNLNAPANLPDSPLMMLSTPNAGRRTKKMTNATLTPLSGTQNYSKPGGSPSPSPRSLPVTPTTTTATMSVSEVTNMERSTSRRQLPGARTGFRGPAIVEEEEEEEEA